MFSIDQLLASPPLSAIISIILMLACDLMGMALLQVSGFFVSDCKNWARWQAPILGAMLLTIVLYPLALADLTSRLFMQIIAVTCMALGAFHGCREAARLYASRKKLDEYWETILAQSHSKKLLIFMLLGMGLLAMGPVTSADSLDYHLGIAISILNNGGMPVAPEWFIGRLAGNGEVLNAMAMSVGAEQFGSLLQYVSLLGIVGIIISAQNSSDVANCRIKFCVPEFIALAACSTPVLLFLISSPKPQMWPIAMTTLAFVLVIHPSRHHLSRLNALIGYSMVCLLVMTASQAKFNYLLGGGVVGVLAFVFMVRQRYLLSAVGITLISAMLILAPPIFWKATVFNASWLDALINPLPGHLPGTDAMIAYSQVNPDTASNLPFPFSILIPSSIGSLSAALGVSWLIFIGLRPGRDLWLLSGMVAAVVVVVVSASFAPPAARMYMEPYFWLMCILSTQPDGCSLGRHTWIKWPIVAQALLTTAACWLGVVLLLPGALSPTWRTHVMNRYANGYEIMQWADAVLPKNAVLLNGHRSMALAPRDAVNFFELGWIGYVDTNTTESHIYLDRLKSKKVSHVLIVGQINDKSPLSKLSKCFGRVIAGPAIGHVATRNPFNQGLNYEAWILEFESEKLPDCATHPNGRVSEDYH